MYHPMQKEVLIEDVSHKINVATRQHREMMGDIKGHLGLKANSLALLGAESRGDTSCWLEVYEYVTQ